MKATSRLPILVALACAVVPATGHAPLAFAYQRTPVDAGEPFPSPDGKSILYESLITGRYQIVVMDIDSSNVAWFDAQ